MKDCAKILVLYLKVHCIYGTLLQVWRTECTSYFTYLKYITPHLLCILLEVCFRCTLPNTDMFAALEAEMAHSVPLPLQRHRQELKVSGRFMCNFSASAVSGCRHTFTKHWHLLSTGALFEISNSVVLRSQAYSFFVNQNTLLVPFNFYILHFGSIDTRTHLQSCSH